MWRWGCGCSGRGVGVGGSRPQRLDEGHSFRGDGVRASVAAIREVVPGDLHHLGVHIAHPQTQCGKVALCCDGGRGGWMRVDEGG